MGIFKKDTIYIEKHIKKHEHVFNTHVILEITIATGEIIYYNVKKCKHCNSFECISEEDNPQGKILRPLNKRESKLAIITADYNKRDLQPKFSHLKNIQFCKANKKSK